MITVKQLMKLNTAQEALDILRYARNNYISALQAKAGYIAPCAEFDPMPVPYDKPLELCRQNLRVIKDRMYVVYHDPIEIWLENAGMEDYWTHAYKQTGVYRDGREMLAITTKQDMQNVLAELIKLKSLATLDRVRKILDNDTKTIRTTTHRLIKSHEL